MLKHIALSMCALPSPAPQRCYKTMVYPVASREDTNVKRLNSLGRVRWEDEDLNSAIIACCQESKVDVTGVSVHDEELAPDGVRGASFCVKHLH